MRKLSIVDDDQQMSRILGIVAGQAGYHVSEYSDVEFFLTLQHGEDELILLDLCMPGIDGIEVIRNLAEKRSSSSLVLMSGQDESVLHAAMQLASAHNLRCITTLTKPIRISEFKNLLEQLKGSVRPPTSRRSKEAWLPNTLELAEAIKKKQMLLHYQPQIDLSSGSLVGVEALVRWAHPNRGLVPPNMFIPLAENLGLISDLTNLVIEMALDQSHRWSDMGFNLNMSVNISADNISSLSLPEQLADLINDKRLDPSHLILEITESALMGELSTSLDILTRLRMKGFSLSIDDFGTGYSSLSLLHKVPFTELKIDQSFVMNMAEDVEAHAIVETCVMLGHKLNMRVVAEGVETEQAMNALREMKCDTAQGYFIARPMPEDKFSDWIASTKVNVA